ncbi:MAG: radical SAM family heme chaperone HemW [Planctomycetota bacterium]
MHLYIHVPYCVAKCPYCDFNSVAGRDDEHTAYVDALIADVRCLPRGPYQTIFIGGGTPTILGERHLDRLLAGIRCHITLAPQYEWTCEANPGSSDAARFAVLARHGVNRISLGVQSTHEHHLRFLGRVHNAADAERAVAAALAAVPRVSVDLMFGLPNQSEAEVESDLELYRRHQLEHASVYHLTYEPGTEFHAKRSRGEMADIDHERSHRLINLVQERLASLGLIAYETSNFARPGAACRHNLAYWQQHDYHAAGAGAVSTIGSERTTREPHPGRYIAAVAGAGQLIWKREPLSATDRLREAWMLGLRLAEGISTARLDALGDSESRWRPLAQSLADLDLVELPPGHIRLAAKARHIQDELTVRMMP